MAVPFDVPQPAVVDVRSGAIEAGSVTVTEEVPEHPVPSVAVTV